MTSVDHVGAGPYLHETDRVKGGLRAECNSTRPGDPSCEFLGVVGGQEQGRDLGVGGPDAAACHEAVNARAVDRLAAVILLESYLDSLQP